MYVEMRHAVAEAQPVHLQRSIAPLDRSRDSSHLGPETGGLLGRQLVGLGDVRALPDDVRVAAADRPATQVRVAPLAVQDAKPARLDVSAGPVAHEAVVTAAKLVPVRWPLATLGHTSLSRNGARRHGA